MGRRKTFYLIFSKNPPAADVVREDLVVAMTNPVTEGTECTFQWEKSKDIFENTPGKILKQGFKKDLSVLSVNKEGIFVAKDGLGTRRQEKEKERLQQKNSSSYYLQDIAEDMEVNGPDAVCEKRVQPVVKKLGKRSRLPKKRSAARIAELKKLVASLPCFKQDNTKVELCKNSGIYCHAGKLSLARARYRERPQRLLSVLLRMLVPQEIILEDGISATGTRGCVAIPSKIVETITLYVQGVHRASGGKIETLSYDPMEILRNLINNTRRKAGFYSSAETVESEEMDDELPSTPPESSRSPVAAASSSGVQETSPPSPSLSIYDDLPDYQTPSPLPMRTNTINDIEGATPTDGT